MSAESKKASDRATLKISAVPTNLTAETSARGTAEGLLGGRITTEISDRKTDVWVFRLLHA